MLSIVILTKNSADTLRLCLQSVSWADEIVIVDSGSSDDSLTIAKEFTSKIYSETNWQGHGIQRNRALRYCQSDWVLMLDSDECVTAELAQSIQAFVKNPGDYAVASIKRLHYFLGYPLKHGRWNDVVPRLFKRDSARYDEAWVHEQLLFKGQAKKLNSFVNHYSYNSIEQVLEKMNRYTTQAAEKHVQRGKKTNFFKILWRSWWSFINSYFFHLGFLDGKAGYLVAKLDADESYYRYLKLWNKTK